MTFKKRTYCKALLLTIVFSLNTVVSFACSFSNLFHSFHHHKMEEATEHKHAGNHHPTKNDGHKHHHNKVTEHHHDTGSQKQDDDNCCSNKVIEIEKVDKAVSRTIAAPDVIFLTSLFVSYTELYNLLKQHSNVLQHHIRWRHPTTIPDLRIVIQSFQI